MIDAPTQARLKELFRRENRSFLQYISASTPWADFKDRSLVEKVKQLAIEERDALGQLAEWMTARRIAPPYLGAFPTRFTSFNFVDIRKLLQPLIAEQRKELADIEIAANSSMDEEVKCQLAILVDLNRQHLIDFESMTRHTGD